ncbi:ester cyclase [Streptomyces sp. DSM 41527]|uniref:Ester cyclase n=1 Tax=Streptomyces mooreae TaxID=3075523 RepID=A0ABU2SZQ4_9ACTN|nr:ester cyclase [Streptomyces sp. DSM 41527]MDT0454461.1 ester cyclase [Streptomyces sp. DSM 41527]
MDKKSLENLITRYQDEVLNGHNDDLMTEIFHPDFRGETDESALQMETQGDDIQAARDFMVELRSKVAELRYTCTEMLWDGDVLRMQWTVDGIHTGTLMGFPPTNRRFTFSYPNWARFKDGQIITARSEWDEKKLADTLSA